MNSVDKKNLRALFRHHRKTLLFQEQVYAAHAVYHKIITFKYFKTSQHIAFYKANNSEVSIDNVLIKAYSINKKCYLPVLRPQINLDFYPYHLETKLVKNSFGIEEPNTSQEKPICITDLDLIFLPLLAFDKNGNRLGRGRGYYDHALAPVRGLEKPILVGIAYDFQKIDKIPTERWDIPLNFAITEKKIYCFNLHNQEFVKSIASTKKIQ